MDPAVTIADITRLWAPGGVHELRVPKAGRSKTISGYFDNPTDFAAAAARIDREGHPGIYFTVNPVDRRLLSRSANKTKPYAELTTTDKDIAHRHWLVVDLDPIRPTGIPSTDEEHTAARTLAFTIEGELDQLGWPAPLWMDSGNGAYLLYRVDLPNDQPTADLLHRVLGALARYDTDQVKVDQTMYNAARIIRVPGTTNRKGDHTDERPHRTARYLGDQDGGVAPVGLPLLIDLAGPATPTPAKQTSSTGTPAEYDINRVLRQLKHRDRGYKDGSQIWELYDCPFAQHDNHWQAAVLKRANGALVFDCHHDGCVDRTWHDLRALIDPKPVRPDPTSPSRPTPTDIPKDSSEAGGSQARPVDGAILNPGSVNGHDPGDEGPRIRLTRGSQFRIKPVRWVWATPDTHSGWLALGEITLIAGREGVGKSTLLAWMAGQITRGTLPGIHEGQPKAVLYAASEDSWTYTIAPRMIAAGANLDLVYRIDVEEDGLVSGLSLPRDTRQLPVLAGQVDAAVLMCDPILSLVGGQINPNYSKELRRALEPLRHAAEEAGLAVPALAHFNKTKEVDGLSMIAGSRAWVEVARSAMLLAYDEDANHVIVTQAKNNLGRRQEASRTYVLADTVLETDEGVELHIGRVQWGDDSTTTAESVLQRTPDRTRGADTDSAILQELSDAAGQVRSPHQIAEATGLNHSAVRTALRRMAARNQVHVQRHGLYQLPLTTETTCETCRQPLIPTNGIRRHPTCRRVRRDDE